MFSRFFLFTAVVLALAAAVTSRAQTTAFTYQGQLMDGGTPATGAYDFQLNVYDAASGGHLVNGPLLMFSISVTNGLFTLTPDFGPGVFTGPGRWLDIGVRKAGGNSFTTLTTRQQLTSVPYAVLAANAGTVTGTLAVSNLPPGLALLASNQTFSGSVQLTNVNNTFIGNGAGVTNVSVYSVNSGGAFAWAGSFRQGAVLPTGSQPAAVAAGDFNNDGLKDLVAVGFADGSVITYTNIGNNSFAPATTNILGGGAGSISVAVGDFRNTGRQDIAVANFTANVITILTNSGSNSFVFYTNLGSVANPEYVTAVDINGDNRPDLVVANANSTVVTVFTNNGSGFFTVASQPSVGGVQVSVAVADVNGDGRPDLVTANYNNTTLSVFTNKGGGQFGAAGSVVVGANPRAVVALDLNGDGRMDLACVDYGSGELVTLTNNGSGVFTTNGIYFTGPQPVSVVATNVTGSNKPDLVVANSGTNTLSIFTNNGSGGFGLATTVQTGANPQSIIAGDYNGDGRPDLAVACTGANEVSLLYSAVTFNAGNLAVWGSFTVNSNMIYYPGTGTNVGINNSSPAYTLDVHGTVNASGNYFVASDARYKTNIETLIGALDKIMALRGVGYDLRRTEFPEMNFNDTRQLGFIAQELQKVVPEAVTQDAQGHYSVAYGEVIPVLVEALKEEKSRADAAAEQANARMDELQKQISALQKLAAESGMTNAAGANGAVERPGKTNQ